MAVTKVPHADLRAFLDAGHSQSQAARHFGVSEAAIHQRLKRMRALTSRVVALERAGALVDQQLTAAQRLEYAQGAILEQLHWAEEQARQPGVDRAALTGVLTTLSAEVRAHVRLEHDISRTLVDLHVVREFQRTVFEVIRDVNPEVARQILARLKERQALRHSVEFPTLDGRGAFEGA